MLIVPQDAKCATGDPGGGVPEGAQHSEHGRGGQGAGPVYSHFQVMGIYNL